MMNRFHHILYIVIGVLLGAGCQKNEEDLILDDVAKNNVIELQCTIENNSRIAYSSGEIGTKSLINQTSNTDALLCNFLRLEANDGDNWAKSYLSEGTIATVPTGDKNLRSISLHPAQPYNTTDATSKMIGWYPRTDEVPQTAQGNDVTIQYENFKSTCVDHEGKTCVKFTGLDGSKDLMVSDLKEGSINNPFNNSNYFAFKHYLSAIRVYAKAEKSPQDIGLWKEIEEVVIRKQPTSCIVELPSEIGTYANVVEWGTENAKLKIQKTHIFGENDTDYEDNQAPEQYPIKLEGSSMEKYLGYSLIQPNSDVTIQVHTNAGVYDVVIPYLYGINKTKIFDPGYIYDVHISFQTDGTIFAFIEKDGGEKYFDLSAGHEYDNTERSVYDYKNANCYIIHPGLDPTNQYDGFCFDATVVGNGDGGIISTGAQTFYPQTAHIEPCSAEVLWQTSPRLVSQIELSYGYVRFKVAREDDSTYKEGNAVIAVYDKDMNVLWSWHIWITDTPKDLTYTEGETSITIMDRNLGATFGATPGNSVQALESYGLYYQWGRKDPSMGPPTHDYSPINMITAPYYDYSSEKKEAAEVVRLANPTLKDAVENPMYLILPTVLTQTYYFNWLYEKIDFLWGYNETTGATHKTIYDPCPYGYRVSGGELADLFTYASGNTGEIENGTYGQVVKVPKVSGNAADKESFFFPYSGYKGVDRGLNSLISSWKYVGQKGDYQSSIVSMYTGDEEYYMHRSRIYLSKDRTWNELNVGDYTGHQIQDHTNRRTAAPVRCVKNIEHKRLMAFITPNKYTITSAKDTVNFTLYAYAFDAQITSATLSIGYHLDGANSHEHHEVEIESWSSDLGAIWKPDVYTYKFKELKDIVDIYSTTGEFRFILNVKTEDNIYRQSSTTIRLEKNSVEFLNWENQETMFANTEIDKRFRVYGDSEPEKVEVVQRVGDEVDSSKDIVLVDVTKTAQKNSGSEYANDFNYATDKLKFTDVGTYYVYLRVKLANGQELISEIKQFRIEAQQWVEITSTAQIKTSDVYLIMNVNSDDFAYDNGVQLYAKAVYDDACHFKFETSGNKFLIKNINSTNYVNLNSYSIQINATTSSSAAEFVLEYYSQDGGFFKIGTKVKKNHTYYYYWQQVNSPGVININTDRDNLHPMPQRWKIYKKS